MIRAIFYCSSAARHQSDHRRLRSGFAAVADLLQQNCVRFRFSGSGAIYKWELQMAERLVVFEIGGNLTVSDSMFNVEAALDGVALAYTFEPLVLPHIRAKTLKRVLIEFSPTFPGFYLYYPSRKQQPAKLKAFVEHVLAHFSQP